MNTAKSQSAFLSALVCAALALLSFAVSAEACAGPTFDRAAIAGRPVRIVDIPRHFRLTCTPVTREIDEECRRSVQEWTEQMKELEKSRTDVSALKDVKPAGVSAQLEGSPTDSAQRDDKPADVKPAGESAPTVHVSWVENPYAEQENDCKQLWARFQRDNASVEQPMKRLEEHITGHRVWTFLERYLHTEAADEGKKPDTTPRADDMVAVEKKRADLDLLKTSFCDQMRAMFQIKRPWPEEMRKCLTISTATADTFAKLLVEFLRVMKSITESGMLERNVPSCLSVVHDFKQCKDDCSARIRRLKSDMLARIERLQLTPPAATAVVEQTHVPGLHQASRVGAYGHDQTGTGAVQLQPTSAPRSTPAASPLDVARSGAAGRHAD